MCSFNIATLFTLKKHSKWGATGLFYHVLRIPECRNAGSQRDSLKCHCRNVRLPSKKQPPREILKIYLHLIVKRTVTTLLFRVRQPSPSSHHPSVAKPKSSYSGMTSGIRYRLWNSNSWWYQVLQPLFCRLQNPFHFAKLPSNWSGTALELLGAAQWNSILGVVATSRKGLNLSNLNKRLLIEAYSIQLLKPPRVWFHSGFGSEFEHVTTPSWHDPTAIPNQPKMALEPLYNSVNFSMINKK